METFDHYKQILEERKSSAEIELRQSLGLFGDQDLIYAIRGEDYLWTDPETRDAINREVQIRTIRALHILAPKPKPALVVNEDEADKLERKGRLYSKAAIIVSLLSVAVAAMSVFTTCGRSQKSKLPATPAQSQSPILPATTNPGADVRQRPEASYRRGPQSDTLQFGAQENGQCLGSCGPFLTGFEPFQAFSLVQPDSRKDAAWADSNKCAAALQVKNATPKTIFQP